eukprot:COSAG02_NODE_4023_length_5895_cov_5.596788_4_plen_118_part_00
MSRCRIAASASAGMAADDSNSTVSKSSEGHKQKPSSETGEVPIPETEGTTPKVTLDAAPEEKRKAAEAARKAEVARKARELELNNLTTQQGVLESLRRAGVSESLVAKVTDKATTVN